MLKVLILQRLYNISDNQVEYQIKDRMSFREFLDIQSVEDVPDEKTVWKYMKIMADAGIGIKLFEKFNEQFDAYTFLKLLLSLYNSLSNVSCSLLSLNR